MVDLEFFFITEINKCAILMYNNFTLYYMLKLGNVDRVNGHSLAFSVPFTWPVSIQPNLILRLKLYFIPVQGWNFESEEQFLSLYNINLMLCCEINA